MNHRGIKRNVLNKSLESQNFPNQIQNFQTNFRLFQVNFRIFHFETRFLISNSFLISYSEFFKYFITYQFYINFSESFERIENGLTLMNPLSTETILPLKVAGKVNLKINLTIKSLLGGSRNSFFYSRF